jgi:hypothetical protein
MGSELRPSRSRLPRSTPYGGAHARPSLPLTKGLMLAKVSPLYEGAHACQSLPLPPYEGGDLEGVKRRLNDPSSTVPPTQRNADTCAARVPSPNSAYGSGCAVANSWVSLSPAVRRRSLRAGLLLSRPQGTAISRLASTIGSASVISSRSGSGCCALPIGRCLNGWTISQGRSRRLREAGGAGPREPSNPL